jgi:hypothetical protein
MYLCFPIFFAGAAQGRERLADSVAVGGALFYAHAARPLPLHWDFSFGPLFCLPRERVHYGRLWDWDLGAA